MCVLSARAKRSRVSHEESYSDADSDASGDSNEYSKVVFNFTRPTSKRRLALDQARAAKAKAKHDTKQPRSAPLGASHRGGTRSSQGGLMPSALHAMDPAALFQFEYDDGPEAGGMADHAPSHAAQHAAGTPQDDGDIFPMMHPELGAFASACGAPLPCHGCLSVTVRVYPQTLAWAGPRVCTACCDPLRQRMRWMVVCR